MNPLFSQYNSDDLKALIEEYPLAWVSSPGASIETPALLPLVGNYDDEGNLCEIIGHLMRSNPLFPLLSNDPTVHILFTGPDGYISPTHAGKKNWGPTWNYAAARIEGRLSFSDEITDHALDVLIVQCERKMREPWSKSFLGERYEKLRQAIIGFTVDVTHIDATFKLAQDESTEILQSILSHHPNENLINWMKRMRPSSKNDK